MNGAIAKFVTGLNPTAKWSVIFVVMTTALILGVRTAFRVFRDAKGDFEPEAPTADDLLGPLTQAFAAGQMSKEEYLRIRDSIARGEPWTTPSEKPAVKSAALLELPPAPEPPPPQAQPPGEG